MSIESTAVPKGIAVDGPVPAGRSLRDGYVVRISLSGVGLTMAEDDILVADGVIRTVKVRKGPAAGQATQIMRPPQACQALHREADDVPPGQVALDVLLEYQAYPVVTVVPGMPHRLDFEFPREALIQVFSGKVIAVDPGHGGKDVGIRGPVNLLEKDVALDVAKELRVMLEECGATALMSREDDSDVDPRGWVMAIGTEHPDAVVEIHVSGEEDPMARSYHIFARKSHGESAAIASEVAAALTERMGITFSGIRQAEFPAFPLRPAIRVEPLCLTHFSDEANFRAPLYRKRIAQAIFNGLSRYFSSASGEGVARAG